MNKLQKVSVNLKLVSLLAGASAAVITAIGEYKDFRRATKQPFGFKVEK